MKRWIMTIDIEKCENCNNCFLACKDEYFENDWLPYSKAQPRHGHRWMNILKKEHGQFPCISVAYMPRPCFHCADPPCIKGLNNKEIYKRSDGIVILDPEKSKGRKDLVTACPHGAIWWNEKSQTPQKCTLCAHLLDNGWDKPRCAQACPTGALTFSRIETEDLLAHIRSNNLETAGSRVPSSPSSAPLVLYKNLDHFNTCFIAGSVATQKKGIQECVEGVAVELSQKGEVISSQKTDAFGDFRFSGLPSNSGTYELRLSLEGHVVGENQVELGTSCFSDTIWI